MHYKKLSIIFNYYSILSFFSSDIIGFHENGNIYFPNYYMSNMKNKSHEY
jgi:hypothetical protein